MSERRRLPPLNSLRAFDAAARLKSFSRAADEIGVTHGAVSHQIRFLEDRLGSKLFLRRGRRVELSSAGLAIHEKVGRAFDLLSESTAQIEGVTVRGEVVLSIPPSLSCLWLVQRLPTVLQTYPDITLRLVPSNDDREVRSSSVDLCIRYGDGAWPSRRVERLSDAVLYPVCSPSYLNQNPRLQQSPAAAGAVLLCADDGHEWDLWIAGTAAAMPINMQRQYLGNALIAVEMSVSGYGIALGDNINTHQYLTDGRLVRPFGESVKVPDAFYLLSTASSTGRPAVQLIATWIKQQFSEMA
jgi:LysR family transcriptional regulator, glycine cleavage system transcriptional activator